ncbi:MAG: MFS transporter [Planctomycetota bacterium]
MTGSPTTGAAQDRVFTGAPARVLGFCALGWIFDFHDLVLFAFVKEALRGELSLSTAQLAWVDGITFAAAALGGVLAGRLADRRGRRRVMSLSILLFSTGALLTSTADGFVSLALARFVTGLGVGGEWGVGHAAVAESYPPSLRQRAAAVLQAASPVGLALAALSGCLLAPHIGWRAVFAWSALPAGLVCMARWAMPHEDAPRSAQPTPLRALWDPAHLAISARLLCVLVLHMTGFWCCFAWLPSLLLREGGASAGFVAGFHVALAVAQIVADLVFAPLALRFGRRRTFVGLCTISAIGLAVIAVAFATLRGSLLLSGAALCCVGLGSGTWSAFGTWFADHYGRELRATAASTLYNLGRGSQLIAQPLLAAAAAATGTLAVGLWVGVACALGSAALAPREARA